MNKTVLRQQLNSERIDELKTTLKPFYLFAKSKQRNDYLCFGKIRKVRKWLQQRAFVKSIK